MALTKVQTVTGSIGSVNSISITMSTPPTVGNALIFSVFAYATGLVPNPNCIDTNGNTYILVKSMLGSTRASYMFLCAAVVNNSTPFTVTALVTNAGANLSGNIIEVSGAVGGLEIARSASNTGTSTTPSTGVTAAIQINDVFVVAVVSTGNVTQSSITVQSVSPVWIQEHEVLSAVSNVPTETDSRILTAASGTTQSCSWTISTSALWTSIIGIFGSLADFTPPETRITQNIVETLSSPLNPTVRVTQNVVETLSLPFPAIRTSQYVVELLSDNAVVVPPTSTETTQFLIVM